MYVLQTADVKQVSVNSISDVHSMSAGKSTNILGIWEVFLEFYDICFICSNSLPLEFNWLMSLFLSLMMVLYTFITSLLRVVFWFSSIILSSSLSISVKFSSNLSKKNVEEIFNYRQKKSNIFLSFVFVWKIRILWKRYFVRNGSQSLDTGINISHFNNTVIDNVFIKLY